MKLFRRVMWTAVVAWCVPLFADWILADDPAKVAQNGQDGAEMILIPGGRFLMGSTREEVDSQFRDTGLPEDWKKYTLDEEPRHAKSLKPFYIYKYEVTNEQYRKFTESA